MSALGSLAKIHGILPPKRNRNGEVVRLTERRPGQRWLTSSDFTQEVEVLDEANLTAIPQPEDLAGLLYRSFSREVGDLVAHLEAHHGELPLLHLSLCKLVRAELATLGVDDSAAAQLQALQAAVRNTPGLELCGDGTSLRRFAGPVDVTGDAEMAATDGTFPALLLPASGGLPIKVQLPCRSDYLHTLAEALGARCVCPRLLRRQKARQNWIQPEQPLIYEAIFGDTCDKTIARLGRGGTNGGGAGCRAPEYARERATGAYAAVGDTSDISPASMPPPPHDIAIARTGGGGGAGKGGADGGSPECARERATGAYEAVGEGGAGKGGIGDSLNIAPSRTGAGGIHGAAPHCGKERATGASSLHAAAPRGYNALASRLCGLQLRGDVLLAAVQVDDRGCLRVHEEEEKGRSATLRTLCELLARYEGGLAGYLAYSWGMPLLGSWAVPRPEAQWPKPKNAKMALSEWCMQATGQISFMEAMRDLGAEIAYEEENYGHVGVVTVRGWPAGAPLPPGARVLEEEGAVEDWGIEGDGEGGEVGCEEMEVDGEGGVGVSEGMESVGAGESGHGSSGEGGCSRGGDCCSTSGGDHCLASHPPVGCIPSPACSTSLAGSSSPARRCVTLELCTRPCGRKLVGGKKRARNTGGQEVQVVCAEAAAIALLMQALIQRQDLVAAAVAAACGSGETLMQREGLAAATAPDAHGSSNALLLKQEHLPAEPAAAAHGSGSHTLLALPSPFLPAALQATPLPPLLQFNVASSGFPGPAPLAHAVPASTDGPSQGVAGASIARGDGMAAYPTPGIDAARACSGVGTQASTTEASSLSSFDTALARGDRLVSPNAAAAAEPLATTTPPTALVKRGRQSFVPFGAGVPTASAVGAALACGDVGGLPDVTAAATTPEGVTMAIGGHVASAAFPAVESSSPGGADAAVACGAAGAFSTATVAATLPEGVPMGARGSAALPDSLGATECHEDGTRLFCSLRLYLLHGADGAPVADSAPVAGERVKSSNVNECKAQESTCGAEELVCATEQSLFVADKMVGAAEESMCAADELGSATSGTVARTHELASGIGELVGGTDELVEQVDRTEVLLGGRVVAPAVEDALRATPTDGGQRCVLLRGRLLGAPCALRLHVTIYSASAPAEVPNVLGGGGGGSGRSGGSGSGHAQQRIDFILSFIDSTSPVSIADIGCGEAKLISALLRRRAARNSLRSAVGIDAAMSAAVLRRAARGIEQALSAVAGEGGTADVGGAPNPAPSLPARAPPPPPPWHNAQATAPHTHSIAAAGAGPLVGAKLPSVEPCAPVAGEVPGAITGATGGSFTAAGAGALSSGPPSLLASASPRLVEPYGMTAGAGPLAGALPPRVERALSAAPGQGRAVAVAGALAIVPGATRGSGTATGAGLLAGASPPRVELWRGSLGNVRLSHELVLLVEVVEHLDNPGAELRRFLSHNAPQRLLITTPNKEYNLHWVPQPEKWLAEPLAKRRRPPPSTLPLRNLDHRCEFTRDEFKRWSTAIGAAHGYEVRIEGIGGGALDEYPPHGEWRGAGPITQVAIFERPAGMVAAMVEDAQVDMNSAEQVWPALG